jgi:hypothetical protein
MEGCVEGGPRCPGQDPDSGPVQLQQTNYAIENLSEEDRETIRRLAMKAIVDPERGGE